MLEGNKCFREERKKKNPAGIGIGTVGEGVKFLIGQSRNTSGLLSKELKEMSEACTYLGEESSRQRGLQVQRP